MPHKPDSISIKDSKEGGPEESEEVIEGVGEGGCTSIMGEKGKVMWIPLPKHFGHVPGSLLGVASKWGPICCCQV